MSQDVKVPQLEREVYFNGQLLTAEDLTTGQTIEREMRWLHNRALHDWGIVTGLPVTGRRGDRAVKVSPGMALDKNGREIILTASLVKNIPVVAGTASYYLVALYQADSSQSVVETRSGVCANGGAVRLADDPRIEWRLPSLVKTGVDIVLGYISIKNCKLSEAVSGKMRKMAKPAQQPYIAAGLTAAATTQWKLWKVGQQSLGFTSDIDTSAAKFQAPPQYFAQIVGGRYLASQPHLIAAPFISVSNAQRDGFTLQVALPAGPSGGIINPSQLRDAVKGPPILLKLGWQVSWIAVEE